MTEQVAGEQFDLEDDATVAEAGRDFEASARFDAVADLLLYSLEPEIGKLRNGHPKSSRRPNQHRRSMAEWADSVITFGVRDCHFTVTEDPDNPHRRTVDIVHPNLRDDFFAYGRVRIEIDQNRATPVTAGDERFPEGSDLEPPQYMGYRLSETAVLSPDDMVTIWETPSGMEIRGSEFPDGPVEHVLELTKTREEA